MIIEFFGPPGSGKTTVAQEAARLLASTGAVSTMHRGSGFQDLEGQRLSAGRIWLSRVTGAASRPRLAAACLKHVTDKHGASRLVALCRRDQLMRRLGALAGVHFVDEGPLQSLCGLAAACSVWPLDLVLRVSSPAVAVLVTTDADTSLRRVRSRNRALRFDRLSDSDIRRELATYAKFSSAIAANAPFPVLRVANWADGDVDTLARKVAKQIETVAGAVRQHKSVSTRTDAGSPRSTQLGRRRRGPS